MLGARRPEFLSVDDVVIVALAPRRGAQRERVGARGRLGDAEGLQAQFAAGDLGQISLLLFGIAMPQDRSHRVHLRVAGRAIAAGGVHFLEDRGGRADAKAAAAEFLRDQRGEIAGFGQRRDKIGRIGAFAVERAPVFARELGAQRAHAFADVGEFVRVGAMFAHGSFTSSIHLGATWARPWSIAITSRSTTRARKLTTPKSLSSSRQNSVRIVSPGNTGAENRPEIAVSRAGS